MGVVYVYIAVLIHGCGVCIYSSIDTWVYVYIAVLIHGCGVYIYSSIGTWVWCMYI